jgi:hypothetical protein
MSFATGQSRLRLSRRKRAVFSLGGAFIGLALAELFAWLWLATSETDAFVRLRSAQDELAELGTTSKSTRETIHPYLGWAMNPQVDRGSDLGGRTIPVNALGFNDEEFAIPKRSPDRLVVGVLGGSVAWQMTVLGETAFRETLKQNPLWQEKEIQIVRLAMPGYKQPQQLMALNYLLALGAEFDAIVNIDGYNEIALGRCENFEAGVFVAYPRMWCNRTQDLVDPRVYSHSFRVFEIRAIRQRLAQRITVSWFRWSAINNLIWKVRDTYWENELLSIGLELKQRRDREGRGFAADGPQIGYGDDENAVFDWLRQIWSVSSLQIEYLCQGNGIRYIHVLQPNQYLPGSKPMTGKELHEMFDKQQCYGKAIAKGYPLLIDEVPHLRARGVDIHDLTMLFASIEDPIYVDCFCHFNARGNELLARAVAAKIRVAFEKAK